MVESADERRGDDATMIGWLDLARLGSVLVEGEMRARAVVEPHVPAKAATEVILIHDDHVASTKAIALQRRSAPFRRPVSRSSFGKRQAS